MNESNALVVRPSVTPQLWQMFAEIANAAHTSRRFGLSTPGEAAMKFLFCFENDLPLSAANTGLYIVNGHMAVQSNIIAAQLRRHPDYDYRIVKITDDGCTVEILRRAADGKFSPEGQASFTQDDAKRAGLLDKDNYKNYPSDMYFARALGRAQRRFAPDVFSQPVYTPEEIGSGDVIEGNWRPVPEAPAVKTAPAPDPVAAALDDAVSRFGAEAVMTANGGAIPDTLEEVATIVTRLVNETNIEV